MLFLCGTWCSMLYMYLVLLSFVLYVLCIRIGVVRDGCDRACEAGTRGHRGKYSILYKIKFNTCMLCIVYYVYSMSIYALFYALTDTLYCIRKLSTYTLYTNIHTPYIHIVRARGIRRQRCRYSQHYSGNATTTIYTCIYM